MHNLPGRDGRLHRDAALRHRRGQRPRHPAGEGDHHPGRQAGRRHRLLLRARARAPPPAMRNCRSRSKADLGRRRARGRGRLRRARPRSSSDELAQHAPEKDAVGRERYALASRDFLGATDRPGRDLRVGHRGTRPHDGGAGVDRPRDQARRIRARGHRVPRRRPDPQAARHRCAAAVDAGDERPRRRGAVEDATSTSPRRSSAWSA